jgi:hypothetical protein
MRGKFKAKFQKKTPPVAHTVTHTAWKTKKIKVPHTYTNPVADVTNTVTVKERGHSTATVHSTKNVPSRSDTVTTTAKTTQVLAPVADGAPTTKTSQTVSTTSKWGAPTTATSSTGETSKVNKAKKLTTKTKHKVKIKTFPLAIHKTPNKYIHKKQKMKRVTKVTKKITKKLGTVYTPRLYVFAPGASIHAGDLLDCDAVGFKPNTMFIIRIYLQVHPPINTTTFTTNSSGINPHVSVMVNATFAPGLYNIDTVALGSTRILTTATLLVVAAGS